MANKEELKTTEELYRSALELFSEFQRVNAQSELPEHTNGDENALGGRYMLEQFLAIKNPQILKDIELQNDKALDQAIAKRVLYRPFLRFLDVGTTTNRQETLRRLASGAFSTYFDPSGEPRTTVGDKMHGTVLVFRGLAQSLGDIN